jgi:hypothetical protein
MKNLWLYIGLGAAAYFLFFRKAGAAPVQIVSNQPVAPSQVTLKTPDEQLPAFTMDDLEGYQGLGWGSGQNTGI